MARKAKDTPHLRLRVEPPLLARLQKSADKNERTLTGEIVDRLESSFKRDDMQALMEATVQRLADKLLAANAPGASLAAATSKIINEETFELGLADLSQRYPDTPKEELEKQLRDFHARWEASRGKKADEK